MSWFSSMFSGGGGHGGQGGGWNNGMGGHSGHGSASNWSTMLKAYPSYFQNRRDIDKGNRVILPASVLGSIANFNLPISTLKSNFSTMN